MAEQELDRQVPQLPADRRAVRSTAEQQDRRRPVVRRDRRHHDVPRRHRLLVPVDLELERVIEARVAARCEAESVLWKLRLVAIETLMMGVLVAAAGIVLDQPAMLVLRAAILVAASCFATSSA